MMRIRHRIPIDVLALVDSYERFFFITLYPMSLSFEKRLEITEIIIKLRHFNRAKLKKTSLR